MARDKPKGKQMPATIAPESKLKPVRLDLSGDVHRLLRKVAAEHGVSMAAYARDSLAVHLREEAQRLGIK
jgi:plasmid stability protein